jgi:hypothetical protein
MRIRDLPISKIICIILLIITSYLFVINVISYYRARNFESPLFPKTTLEPISSLFLHFAIVRVICLIVGLFLYIRSKYILSISVVLFCLILLNYFPELLM